MPSSLDIHKERSFMKVSRLLLPALAALFMLSPAVMADPPPPPPDHHGPGGPPGGPGGPGDPMNFLSPEARMMLFADIDAATASMSDEQRHAFMRNRFDSFRAMSDAAKKTFAAGLKARWDALPPEKQAEIKKRMDERRRKGPPPGDHNPPPEGPGH